MKSLADGLPAEIARQVHPDSRKNEAAYWTVRDQLLGQYQGQWIGFANGAVVASGTRPVMVLHAARQAAEHPYIICVGREDEPYRMRRTSFAYDTSYRGEALPVLRIEFRQFSGATGLAFDQVIADTGADTSPTLGGLPTAATRSGSRGAGFDERSRRRFGNDAQLLGLGSSGRRRISMPTTGGFHGERAHPGTRRLELAGRAFSRSKRRGDCQSLIRYGADAERKSESSSTGGFYSCPKNLSAMAAFRSTSPKSSGMPCMKRQSKSMWIVLSVSGRASG